MFASIVGVDGMGLIHAENEGFADGCGIDIFVIVAIQGR